MSSQRLKSELIRTRKIIRKKFQNLRQNRLQTERLLEGGLKNIIEPLRQLATIKKEPIKKELEEQEDDQNNTIQKESQFSLKTKPWPPSKIKSRVRQYSADTPNLRNTLNESNFDLVEDSNTDDVFQPSTSSVNIKQEMTPLPEIKEMMQSEEGMSTINQMLQLYGSLPSLFMKMLISDTENKIDNIYGVRLVAKDDFENNEHDWKIGNASITFSQHNNDFVIKQKTYKGTPGLYQLLFLKHPLQYNNEDLNVYKKILISTSAHKRNYESRSSINRNDSDKFKNIINNLFLTNTSPRRTRSKTAFGMNMKQVGTSNVEYIYWDSINELVNRLRLLYASKLAGNTSVNNEIVSILSELREANIID